MFVCMIMLVCICTFTRVIVSSEFGDGLSTSTEIIRNITHPNRYDKQVRPVNPNGDPVVVSCRVYVYFLKPVVNAKSLQFRVHMLLELRWRDNRLKYSHLTNSTEIIGETWLLNHIWAPHLYFANEKESLVLKGMTSHSDHLVDILPEGDVFFTSRLQTTTLCHMEQGKFPFDQQRCNLIMDSWRYNTSNLILQWEKEFPAVIPNMNPSLADFYLLDMILDNSEEYCCSQNTNINHHHYSYSYSSLVLTFVLKREYGFYIMDYYVPSSILVILSWVTFWLEPDSVPARSLLGASTMLTFILLTSKSNSLSVLKLHFKTNDIWFFGCTAFIFLSLVEFALVNTIHRQEMKKIRLKKATSKNILKTALSPKTLRKRRCSSCPSSPSQTLKKKEAQILKRNFLTVTHFEDLKLGIPLEDLKRCDPVRGINNEPKSTKEKINAIMTTHEIARWVDKKSRIVFPLAFFIFNLFYWMFMFL